MALFLLAGGVVSDRVERRRVMIAADLRARGWRSAIVGVLAVSGSLQLWHLVALVVVFAAGEAFFGPALGAMVPDLVSGRAARRGQLARAVRAPGLPRG